MAHQTLYGFRDGDEIQGVVPPNGRRLTLFTHTRDNGTGRVWIYELKSGQWVEIGKIIGREGERFGQTAALARAGGIIAVGASFANDKKGAVRVFNYLGGTVWEQMGSDIEGTLFSLSPSNRLYAFDPIAYFTHTCTRVVFYIFRGVCRWQVWLGHCFRV